MKKIIVFLLLLSIENLGFSSNTPKSLRITGLFPVEKLPLLQTLTKDTLLFAYTDTVRYSRYEWGVFYPHKYVAPFLRNKYYKITIEKSAATQDQDIVFVNGISDEDDSSLWQMIGNYEEDQTCFRWIALGLLLAIHCYGFWKLRKDFFWIYSDHRYETKQRQRNRAILMVLITMLIGIGIGWFAHSYFFLFFPIIYLIFIFLPTSTWYSGMTKRERELDKKS
ncbi:MAG: hypothetical protein WCH65_00955 [bacterium]